MSRDDTVDDRSKLSIPAIIAMACPDLVPGARVRRKDLDGDYCSSCEKRIPPGRPGRRCKECREKESK